MLDQISGFSIREDIKRSPFKTFVVRILIVIFISFSRSLRQDISPYVTPPMKKTWTYFGCFLPSIPRIKLSLLRRAES